MSDSRITTPGRWDIIDGESGSKSSYLLNLAVCKMFVEFMLGNRRDDQSCKSNLAAIVNFRDVLLAVKGLLIKPHVMTVLATDLC